MFGLYILRNPEDVDVDTHRMVVTLGGVRSRWKQVISYHFTGNSADVKSLIMHLLEIIDLCTKIGLNLTNITSDMGSSNRSV